MADHPLFALAYDRLMAQSEARGLAERRRRLLGGACGRVLEIGAGTGANLAYYPSPAVSSVVAIEPDGAMRRRLLRRIAAGGSPVRCEVLEVGMGEARFAEGSFDTVVSTLVLCTVASPDEAVSDIGRWLKPDGQLLFLEHVRATGLRGRIQSVAAPVWCHAAGGCHLDRDTLSVLRQAGLAVTDCERFALPAGGPMLRSCVQGVARPRPVVMV